MQGRVPCTVWSNRSLLATLPSNVSVICIFYFVLFHPFFLHNDIKFLPLVLLCRSKSACGFWSMPFKICSVISSLSPGMLQTAEDPVTLEKVDQGEEMPLSGLVMYACVSVCAQENTHTHSMYRLVLTLHSRKHRWRPSMQLFLWRHTHTHTVSVFFFFGGYT